MKSSKNTVSTLELFSFAYDCEREELWGTLKQASFSLVFAKNREHAHDWFIVFCVKMKSFLNALLCVRRILQIFQEEKAFWCWKFWLLIKMELKDPETPNKSCNVDLRGCRCYASHFQACHDAINIFGKLGVKKNVDAKMKQIKEIEVTPDCEEVLPTKICRKFANYVRACAVRVQMARFWPNSCSVFQSFGSCAAIRSEPLVKRMAKTSKEAPFYACHKSVKISCSAVLMRACIICMSYDPDF